MPSEDFIFTSIDIVLDEDVTKSERRFDTILNLISDVGGVFKGLTIIFGILLFQWQQHNHDRNLA